MVRETRCAAERMDAPRAMALCECFQGALDFQRGRWDEAEADLRRAIDRYRNLGSAAGESTSLQRLGVLLTARGKVDEGMEALGDGMHVSERATMRSHLMTRLEASAVRNRLAAGDVDAALDWLRRGEKTAERHGQCSTCKSLLLPEAVRARIVSGDLEGAEADCEALEKAAEEYASRLWTATAMHARGRLHAAKGDWTKAGETLRQARASYTAIGADYDAARCLTAEANVLRRSGNPGAETEAGELDERARVAFAELGAGGVED
jgi:ATP/maltotriose-dependent transcriptional regulator MalT